MSDSKSNTKPEHSIHLIINKNAGGAQPNLELIEQTSQQWQQEGRDVALHILDPDAIDQCVKDIAEQDSAIVVVGGGDGTVRRCAELLRDSGHSLGILPVGTANLLARSLDVPLDIAAALQVVIDGKDLEIDAVEMNGQLFFNVCSVGLYPALTKKREQRRKSHLHWPKFIRWIVDTSVSGYEVMQSWRHVRFKLTIDGEVQSGKVISFALANNDKLPLFEKARLDSGEIVIYLPKPTNRFEFFVLMLRAIIFHPKEIALLEVQRSKEVTIEIPAGTPMTLDGESVAVDDKLIFKSLPGCYRFRTP